MKKILLIIVIIHLFGCSEKNYENIIVSYNKSQAKRNFHNKEYTKALKNLNKVVSLKPDDYDAIKSISIIYYTQKDYRNALVEIELIPEGKHNEEIFVLKSKIFYELNQYRESLEMINQAIKINSSGLNYLFKAKIYDKLNDPHWIIENYQIIMNKVDDLSNNDINWLSKTLYKYKKYNNALIVINKAIIKESLNPFFFETKGLILMGMKNYDEAIKSFKLGLNLSDESNVMGIFSFHYFLSSSYYYNNDYHKALQEVNLIDTLIRKNIDKFSNFDDSIQNPMLFYIGGNNILKFEILDKTNDFIGVINTCNEIISFYDEETKDDILPLYFFYYVIAINHYKLSEQNNAILNYKQALKLDSEYHGNIEKLVEFDYLNENISILRKIDQLATK